MGSIIGRAIKQEFSIYNSGSQYFLICRPVNSSGFSEYCGTLSHILQYKH